ncbi:MAG: adenosylmethionine--8-amino-7-oxononanoate transaminase [Verrucomicrobiales bacterium]|nr:adenosylmethionine--8-amino-7-oxononanoate transaminase [Verrucomicrobiales bacterium]
MPHPLAETEKRHLWHPFTPMQPWCAPEHQPLMIVEGRGCELIDADGRAYLDGNSSIWTNIHGHSHPRLVAAIQQQAAQLSHSSFLGLTHPLAAELAQRLCAATGPDSPLQRVFFSDNGSTAIESAVRMALQYWAQNGQPQRTQLAAFDRAYHGDTLGAVSLGGIAAFRGVPDHVGYPVTRLTGLENLHALPEATTRQLAAIVIEPLIQGAAGMRLWPPGLLRGLAAWCREHDVFLILDEVMTGFGRTGSLFACQQEGVIPDFLALAKGLTGGTVPLAATLTTERVFQGFLGLPEEERTFYYGHSYTAYPLGCAAALASLDVFEEEHVLAQLPAKEHALRQALEPFSQLPHVAEIRQCGLIAGIDLVASREPLRPFPPAARLGARVCQAARDEGLLTRPIRDTLVLMPPLAATEIQIQEMAARLLRATHRVIT